MHKQCAAYLQDSGVWRKEPPRDGATYNSVIEKAQSINKNVDAQFCFKLKRVYMRKS
jgi:hypothetical protein